MGYKSIHAPALEFVYSAGFKVASVSDTTTDLTDPIVLRPGTWIIMARTPPVPTGNSSTANCILDFAGPDNSEFIFGKGWQTTIQYGFIIAQVKLTAQRSIILRSGTGQATYTWRSEYLERGGICAFRIGD